MNDTSYSWNKSFVLPYESEWSIKEKFCYLNAFSSIDNKKFKEIVTVPEDYRSYDQIKWYPFTMRGVRACPKCIRSGYHSIIHDLGYFDYCFIHKHTQLQFYTNTPARTFKKSENQLYIFLPEVRAIDLIDNHKLKMKIDAYKTLIKDLFPEQLCILDFAKDKQQERYGELYENTKFSLMERCFMPNNPWIRGTDRLLLQIDSSDLHLENIKCLWKAAKYCKNRNTEWIPAKIFCNAKDVRCRGWCSGDFRLGIIFRNYFDEKIIELFSTKKEYEVFEDSIKRKKFKLKGLKNCLQLSMYLIHRSVSKSDSVYADTISRWENEELSLRENYMPTSFFDINYLEDEFDESPDKLNYLYFKEVILRNALDYAIQELSYLLNKKLISMDKGIWYSYYPVKFPQFIIKKNDDKWCIFACNPPEGLPHEFYEYERIYTENIDKFRSALKRIPEKQNRINNNHI